MTSFAPEHTTAGSYGSADPFEDRYGRRLPTQLHDRCAGMTWEEFLSMVAGPATPDLIDHIESRGSDGGLELQVHLSIDGVVIAATGSGAGVIGAFTDILYRLGHAVEITEFHQYSVPEGCATLVRVMGPRGENWGMAITPSPLDSQLAALAHAA